MNWNNLFGVYEREATKAEINNYQIGRRALYKQKNTFVWILSALQPCVEEKEDIRV